jgi:peptidoglycan/LPS O-acetylase OafA/YrhL
MTTRFNNNFDILRLLLSLVVFFYHAEIILGINLPIYFSGEFAVKCFFVVSGYLIVKSYISSKSLKAYSISRFFRVYPLYLLLIILTSCLSAVYIYLINSSVDWLTVAKYFIFNSVFANFLQPTIPYVFDGNENYPSIINGSLWTLKVEVAFYILVPLVYHLGSNKNHWLSITAILFLFSSVLGFFISVYVEALGLPAQLNNQIPTLLIYFMGGAFFNFIRLEGLIFFIVFLISCFSILFLDVFEILESVFISFFVMYLALGSPVKIAIPSSVGDLSFFIYLFHFPILQVMSFYSYDYGVYNALGFSLLICTAFAWLSWHYLESPLLNYVKLKVKQ